MQEKELTELVSVKGRLATFAQKLREAFEAQTREYAAFVAEFAQREQEMAAAAAALHAWLKGSIGEGPNHSNFSLQSSVKILSKFSTFP